jgi:hypothetical protein
VAAPPEAIRRRLEASQRALLGALEGITEEQFKRRPPATEADPAPWSIAEVLAHLLSNERLWVDRISLALRSDGASITPSPEAAHEEGARVGRQVPVPQLIHGLLGVRRELLKLLDAATAAEVGFLPKGLWHPRLGEHLDLAAMFGKVASHHEEHLAQVEELRRAVGAHTAGRSAP